MKTILAALVFLSLFCASFASVDAYYSSKGLHITRTLDNVKYAAISTTTGAAAYTTKATIVIKVKNSGATEKRDVLLTDGLSYISPSLKIAFSSAPQLDGQIATWKIGTLSPLQEYSVSLNISGAVNEDTFKSLASPKVSYTPIDATLSVPASARAGESVRLSLLFEGKPLANATIFVLGPGDERFSLQTDAAGQAAYIAGTLGFYTYSSDDANIGLASTEIKSAIPVQAPAAGALLPKEEMQAFDLLPFALGLAMLAAVAIALFTLFGSRSPEESITSPSSEAAPPFPPSGQFAGSGQPKAEQAYSQSAQMGVQFASSMPQGSGSTLPLHEEKKMQEVLSKEATVQHAKQSSKSVYEKRKLELAQKQAELLKKAHEQKKAAAKQAPQKRRNHLLSAAYAAGSTRGESAVEDHSIEKTIAELEKIRAKLKKKNSR